MLSKSYVIYNLSSRTTTHSESQPYVFSSTGQAISSKAYVPSKPPSNNVGPVRLFSMKVYPSNADVPSGRDAG